MLRFSAPTLVEFSLVCLEPCVERDLKLHVNWMRRHSVIDRKPAFTVVSGSESPRPHIFYPWQTWSCLICHCTSISHCIIPILCSRNSRLSHVQSTEGKKVQWCLPHRLSDILQYLSLPPLINFCIHQSLQHPHCLCLSADPHQLSLGLFHYPHLWSSFYGVLNPPVACISISLAWLGRFPTPCFSQCWLS